jgi:hypothetical protein
MFATLPVGEKKQIMNVQLFMLLNLTPDNLIMSQSHLLYW